MGFGDVSFHPVKSQIFFFFFDVFGIYTSTTEWIK